MTRFLILAAALAVLVARPLRGQAEGEVGLPIGTVPDPVVIEDLDGTPYDLAQVIGRQPVVLQFWATWCENCKALEPEMAAAHREYGESVAFLAVAVAVGQTKRAVRRNAAREPVPYRVVWDTRGRATRAFRAPTTSYVVILDASGTVIYTGVGPDQDVRGALRQLSG